MSSLFIDTPISLVREDPRYPDRDTHYIYDHLKYLLSRPRSFPLPAMRVMLDEDGLSVTDGHKYLRIARELGHPKLRAILGSSSTPNSELIAQLPQGVTVIPKGELERELKHPWVNDYHVYFFDEPLTPEAQEKFASRIAGFFETLKSPLLEGIEKRVTHVAFPFGARCAEFQAVIPLGDQSWFPAYLAVARNFSRDVAHISTFQGGTFPGR
jgi:hypothetical protein